MNLKLRAVAPSLKLMEEALLHRRNVLFTSLPEYLKHYFGVDPGEKYSTRLTATSETNITPV
jgi:hypothetical protein